MQIHENDEPRQNRERASGGKALQDPLMTVKGTTHSDFQPPSKLHIKQDEGLEIYVELLRHWEVGNTVFAHWSR